MKLYPFFFVIIASVFMPLPQIYAQDNCLPPRLVVGEQGFVIPPEPNRLRAEPSTSSEQIGVLEPNIPFDVLETEACSNGIMWVRVRAGTREGWTAEGNATTYFIEPIVRPTATPSATGTTAPTATATIDPSTLENLAEGCVIIDFATVDRSRREAYYLYRFETDTLTPLPVPVAPFNASPSPDGRYLTFTMANRNNEPDNRDDATLYLQDAQTGELRVLLEGVDEPFQSIDMTWSPNSRLLAYFHRIGETNNRSAVYVLTPEGEVLFQRDMPPIYSVYWSEDGDRLVVRRFDETVAFDIATWQDAPVPDDQTWFRYSIFDVVEQENVYREDSNEGSRSMRVYRGESSFDMYYVVVDNTYNAVVYTSDPIAGTIGMANRPCEWFESNPLGETTPNDK